MAQYIDKSALVAEIKKTYNFHEKRGNIHDASICDVLYGLLHRIDTLEVKEVDLEKEIRTEIDEYWYDNDYGAIQRHGGTITMEVSDVKEIAKHFFELGLRSTITEEDCKLIWNIGDEIPNMPEEEFFKELLKRYKTQKGK